MSRIWLLDFPKFGHKLEKWQWCHILLTWHQLFLTLFCLSCLFTGLSFMSISSLVLELWQHSFVRDWPEIQKSEISLSEFCPISGDWGKLGILNLAQMSLIKSYWMLQNSRVTAFTISELLRGNQQGGKIPPSSTITTTQIRVKPFLYWSSWSVH